MELELENLTADSSSGVAKSKAEEAKLAREEREEDSIFEKIAKPIIRLVPGTEDYAFFNQEKAARNHSRLETGEYVPPPLPPFFPFSSAHLTQPHAGSRARTRRTRGAGTSRSRWTGLS